MKKQLFEYAVLLHPVVVEGKFDGDTKMIVAPTTLLASNEKVAGLSIARAIPEEYVEMLDRVQIVIRNF